MTETMEVIFSVQERMFENISICDQEPCNNWVDKIRKSLILLLLSIMWKLVDASFLAMIRPSGAQY